MLIASSRVGWTRRVALAWVAAVLFAPAAAARADTLTQSDWSAGPGTNSSAVLNGETGFATTAGQWSFGVAGELSAARVVFIGGAGASTHALRPVESASSALAYVGFTGCPVTLSAPAPACRTLNVFVHRDTTTGVLSLVSVADGSGQNGCSGGFEAAFTADSGVTLAYSDDAGEATLAMGMGSLAHTWSNGCGDGSILTLASGGSAVTGAITGRTNLQEFNVFVDVPGDERVSVSLASLPNNGGPGVDVPFAFRGGLMGSLESAAFALGSSQQPQRVELDADVVDATLEVYVRTAADLVALDAAPWVGPFAANESLTSVPPGAFLQYRLDVRLADPSGMPTGPEASARVDELRIEYEAPCPCVIDATCYADGDPNPANPCERCDAGANGTAWTALDGDPCDDGLFCTDTDTCVAGACVGGASPCGDGLSCTDDACDEGTDSCSHVVSTGCAIEGACLTAGAINPGDSCEVCDPLRPTQWSVAPGCSGCNSSAECLSPGLGVCDPSDHTCVACSADDSSACGGSSPVCDPSARSCRPCASDVECASDGSLRCASDGRCVGCIDHSDCPSATPICSNNTCAVCIANVECADRDPGAGLCDQPTGRCGSCQDASMCRNAVSGEACLPTVEGNRCGCRVEADCIVGSTCDVSRQRCYPLATADSDGDGVPDDKDADDDNDGIADLVEGAGQDFSLDFDQDGTPNWRDPDAPRFTDANGDGTDDASDADGDGVPNQLDLDADGDGVPDLLENAGRDVLDRDRNGRLDDARDADRDGLYATVDADDEDPLLATSVVPRRDTDDDGSPDYLDADADAEGEGDTREAGGLDADGDGRLDGFSDANMNGLADRVDPESGGTPLPLPDADGDGMWDFQDDSDLPRVGVEGGGLCAVAPVADRALRARGAGAASVPGWLIGLCFCLTVAGWRARRRRD